MISVEIPWHSVITFSRSHAGGFHPPRDKIKGTTPRNSLDGCSGNAAEKLFCCRHNFLLFLPGDQCRLQTHLRRKYPGSTATVLYYSSLIGCWAVIRAGIMTDTSKEPWEGRKQEKWQWFLFFSGILLSFFCNFWQPADLYGCMLCIILFFFFWKRAWIQLWWRHFCVIKKCWLCHTSRRSFRL